eukprot:CAMPEP_0203680950 /NCGR_PEP_ID=MMETSP0090-20130426/41198_1 /ASSEMBLY_ACC=CAM_ASM_001088 /TAXON_ID=426623 /ORGANISM="Chaetoceros affinis, Strain CCMP159" /LENGTH=94 /DNA_ID=CAMNT_0050549255 /DNA_START=260 /DNA_END=544 /DNA_ORIENTATION=-
MNHPPIPTSWKSTVQPTNDKVDNEEGDRKIETFFRLLNNERQEHSCSHRREYDCTIVIPTLFTPQFDIFRGENPIYRDFVSSEKVDDLEKDRED